MPKLKHQKHGKKHGSGNAKSQKKCVESEKHLSSSSNENVGLEKLRTVVEYFGDETLRLVEGISQELPHIVAHDMIVELIRPQMEKADEEWIHYMAYALEAVCSDSITNDRERFRKYGSVTNAQS